MPGELDDGARIAGASALRTLLCVDWSVICAATLMTSAAVLAAFLLFQRELVQSFMRAGIH